MILRTLAAAAVIISAAPAFAQPTSSNGAVVAPMATPSRAGAVPRPGGDQNKKIICKYTGETGTRLMGHRVCLSQADWQERDQETRQTMDRVQQGFTTPH